MSQLSALVLDLPVPSDERVVRGQRRAWALLVLSCVICALVGRLGYLARPFDHDAGMFIYMGKVVCEGGRFGQEICDNKFPTVGLMTSLCWRAFGTNWASYVVLQTILSIGGALLLGRSAARHVGTWAYCPTVLFALVYMNFSVTVFGGFQLETMQSFFCILAAGAAMEALGGNDWRDAFAAGLSAGCAAMFKPTALGVAGAFAVALVAGRWGDWRVMVRHLLAVAAGVGLVGIAALSYLVGTGILGQLPELIHQIARYAGETPLETGDFLKPAVVLTLAGFPLVVRGWVFRREKFKEDNKPDAIGAIGLFVVTWFCVELAGGVAQRRMYAYHFFPVAAPAALLFGMIQRRSNPLALAAALGPMMILSILGAGDVIRYDYIGQDRLAMSDYLLAHAKPRDAVWQDSMPRLLLETDLHPGSRYPLTFLFLNYDTAALDYGRVILADLAERKPRWIILPSDVDARMALEVKNAAPLSRRPVRAKNYVMMWRWIEQFTKTRYQPVIRIENETLYERLP